MSILPDHALDNISPVGGGEHKDEAAADDDDAGQFHVSENSVFLNHIKAWKNANKYMTCQLYKVELRIIVD